MSTPALSLTLRRRGIIYEGAHWPTGCGPRRMTGAEIMDLLVAAWHKLASAVHFADVDSETSDIVYITGESSRRHPLPPSTPCHVLPR